MNKQRSKYEIDQSGKIEHTSSMTVIALANATFSKTIKITAVEKRKLIKAMIQLKRPHTTYVYHIFSTLIFILLSDKKIYNVLIDIEYPGHNASIKEKILQLLQRGDKKVPEIEFGLVGKKSFAHKAALAVFQKKQEADVIVKAEDIVGILSNKKGWRPQSG